MRKIEACDHKDSFPTVVMAFPGLSPKWACRTCGATVSVSVDDQDEWEGMFRAMMEFPVLPKGRKV